MRILVVSPYPPLRDGIAAYAVQVVAALRAEGHEVEVVSPGPSAAHHHLDLRARGGSRALARLARRCDKLVIQFHPDVFYAPAATARRHAAASLALTAAVRAAPRSEVFVHEIDYRLGRRRGLDGLAARRLWRSVGRVLVHTERERRDFIEAFGVRPDRVHVVAHGEHFVRRTSATREAARASLGIPAHELVFLAIGFIQPHKGFDRAVRAFAGLGAHGCSLHVVGSLRVDEPAYVDHVEELRDLVRATPGAHLHEGYVSDEQFDRWLVAGDVVVLPYRQIWSSGVLERALLYGRRVIATAVGGLGHQAGDRTGVTLVDEAGLAAAMWREGSRAGQGPAARAAWPAAGDDLRERVQEEVVARAARQRGGPVESGGTGAGIPPSTPLARLRPLVLPAPTSRRPGFALLKRLVRGATAFEIDPLVDQVNALRAATVQALERSARQTVIDSPREPSRAAREPRTDHAPPSSK